MKNRKMVQIFFILVCLIGYRITTAQSDYVVTAQGDTIKGSVKYLNYGVEKKVQVITPDGKKIIYSILQAKSFKMDNDIYNTVRAPQGYAFMKVVKSGYLSLYSFQQPNQITWNGSYILKRDGTGMEVPTISFKKLMNRFLSDCPNVTTGIESGELTRSKLTEIIDLYNGCIDYNTRNQNVVQTDSQKGKIDTWNLLEKDVNNLEAFEGKANALEMISEIKSKIKGGEKVPNFLLQGIKESLKDQNSVKELLEVALQTIQN